MVHLTARDGAALAWIGEQFAVRADVAAVVLARQSARLALSRRTVRVQLDRWERAGLMLRQRLYGQYQDPAPAERMMQFVKSMDKD